MMLGGGVLFSWQQKPNQSVFAGNSKNRLDFTKKQEILLKTRFMVSLVFIKNNSESFCLEIDTMKDRTSL